MIRRIAAAIGMCLLLTSCAAAASPSTLPKEPATTVTEPPQTIATTTTLPFPETTEPSGPRSRAATPLATDRAEVPVVDDLVAEVFFPVDAPSDEGVYPTIVFFHGGSWYGGDPTSTSEFARTVAGQGAVVYNATYLTGQNGGGFPLSYEDVACALQTAGATAADYGGSSVVAAAGHSAGAHLAATVAMSADAFSSSRCLDQSPAQIGAFVGLAGPYDTVAIGAFMAPWFGGSPTEVAEAWSLGNPQAYLAEPQFPILLIHGSGDRLVALDSSTVFQGLLEAAGWDTELYVIPAATHNSVIDPIGDGREAAAKIVEVVSKVVADTAE